MTIRWGDVRLAAVVTALVFTVTNYIFGAVLSVFTVTTVTGAAGALMILLLWIFLINQFILYGAAFSAAYVESAVVKPEATVIRSYEHPYGKMEVDEISEEKDVLGRLQEVGVKVDEFRDLVVNEFKDMEVDVKTWNFGVGKTEAEYTLEVNLKLAIKPKKKQN